MVVGAQGSDCVSLHSSDAHKIPPNRFTFPLPPFRSAWCEEILTGCCPASKGRFLCGRSNSTHCRVGRLYLRTYFGMTCHSFHKLMPIYISQIHSITDQRCRWYCVARSICRMQPVVCGISYDIVKTRNLNELSTRGDAGFQVVGVEDLWVVSRQHMSVEASLPG